MTSIPSGGADLDRWLAPVLAVMGHKTRCTWVPLYLRGLLGPGERKSLQPMAARLGLGGHDQLQYFIASTACDDALLWSVLAQQANKLVGGWQAWLVIDDTALLQKGTMSADVAPHGCGQVGKKAKCSLLVFTYPGAGRGACPSCAAPVRAEVLSQQPVYRHIAATVCVVASMSPRPASPAPSSSLPKKP